MPAMMKLKKIVRKGKQTGAVLIMTLVVLVLMTLGAIAMVRSVDSSVLIAGNLAFQQSALQSSQNGVEQAVTWLEANAANLSGTAAAGAGYAANWGASLGPAAGGSWVDYWANVLLPTTLVRTLATDASGNTVSYIVQRLCPDSTSFISSAEDSGCASYRLPPSACSSGKTKGSSFACQLTQYRITARVVGPKNTVTYVQSIVAL